MTESTFLKLAHFIGKKNPNYDFKEIGGEYMPIYPVHGQGFYDENGRQGFWMIEAKPAYYDENGEAVYDLDRNDAFYTKKEFKNDEEIDGAISYYDSRHILLRKGRTKNINGKLVRDGYWEFYYSSAKIQRTATYSNGKYNGLVKEYGTSGELRSYGEYKNGIQVGEHIRLNPEFEVIDNFNEKGELIKKEHKIKNGRNVLFYYGVYGAGVIKIEIYEDGKLVREKSFNTQVSFSHALNWLK